ncbi:MAG TPA: SRPBCC family protein [Candidatus Kapabacteria bacterium]|nr:SRPBCC family protein [Candidatus Kapabacteria bacterium]
MFEVKCSVDIPRPPDVVFAFAGNYANDPVWRSGVLSMVYQTSGAPAAGVRTKEIIRSMGRKAVTIGEIIEYSPSRTAFRSISGPVPCEGSREFVPVASGTRFTYSLTLHPTGFLGLLEPLLKRMFTKQIQADVQRLKRHLEKNST